jgi:hypothetical protein
VKDLIRNKIVSEITSNEKILLVVFTQRLLTYYESNIQGDMFSFSNNIIYNNLCGKKNSRQIKEYINKVVKPSLKKSKEINKIGYEILIYTLATCLDLSNALLVFELFFSLASQEDYLIINEYFNDLLEKRNNDLKKEVIISKVVRNNNMELIFLKKELGNSIIGLPYTLIYGIYVNGLGVGNITLRLENTPLTVLWGNVSYFIESGYRNKGYATKALTLLKKILLENKITSFYLVNAVDNEPSIRVCNKLHAVLVEQFEIEKKDSFSNEAVLAFKWLIETRKL